MQNTLKHKALFTYSIILVSVLILVITNFTTLYTLQRNQEEIQDKVTPQKELFKEYKAKMNELSLLLEQSRSFYDQKDYERINRFQGIVDVELPNLNQKIYLSGEGLSSEDDFFKKNHSIIVLGEELIRSAEKMVRLQGGTPHLILLIQDKVNRLKHLLDYQVLTVSKKEKAYNENLKNSAFWAAVVSALVSTLSIILILIAIAVHRKEVLKPIWKFTQRLSSYGEKNYGESFDYGNSQEFKDLSLAVTKMSESLKIEFDKIEHSNKALKRLTKILKESNEQLEEFAYVASHDLKTPVRGMKNLAMFIEEDYADKLDEEGKSMLQKMQENATKMNALIDDLLNYSKVAKTDLYKERIDLKRLTREVIEYLDYDSNRNLKITVDDLPEIIGDKAKMKSVFTNLFTNAVKYNDSELKTIHVSAKGGQVCFTDNGIGIEEADYPKVFAFFKRAHVEKYEGTGAGMAIVKKILDRHNAPITIQSKVGEGTTFCIDFTKCLPKD